LYITRYGDYTVEMYKEGSEIHSPNLWRTTDDLNVSRLVLQNINRTVKISFPNCGQRGLRIADYKLGTGDWVYSGLA